MARTRTRRHRSRSRRPRRGHRSRQRGGEGGASGWAMSTLGNGWTQFMNALSLQPGANSAAMQSNAIVPVNNPNAQTAQPHLNARMQTVKGGGHRRRHRHRRRGRRGGSLGAAISQASVPFALFAAQHSYASRKRRGRRTRKK